MVLFGPLAPNPAGATIPPFSGIRLGKPQLRTIFSREVPGRASRLPHRVYYNPPPTLAPEPGALPWQRWTGKKKSPAFWEQKPAAGNRHAFLAASLQLGET